MIHRYLAAAATGLTSILTATNAWAHGGTHGHTTVENVIHWLSSPAHSLFAVIAGAVFVSAAIAYNRKRRA